MPMLMPPHCGTAGKAGADVLFVDPQRKSSTLGVTVSPVRVDSLDAFGDLDTVASRLLQAERAKVISCCRVPECLRRSCSAQLHCAADHTHNQCHWSSQCQTVSH